MIWNDASNVLLAGVQATKVVAGTGTGTTVVWQAWSDSGITKVGVQGIPQGTWTKVIGWSVRTGYPDTVIESDGIRVPADTYTISAQVDYDYTSVQNMGARVCLDGAVIPSLTVGPAFKYGAQSVSATVTLAGGLVTVEGYHGNGNSIYRQIQPTTTWLTITRV